VKGEIQQDESSLGVFRNHQHLALFFQHSPKHKTKLLPRNVLLRFCKISNGSLGNSSASSQTALSRRAVFGLFATSERARTINFRLSGGRLRVKTSGVRERSYLCVHSTLAKNWCKSGRIKIYCRRH